MSATKNLSMYVHDIGINLSELSKKSGISYSVIYASLGDSNSKKPRELRADEFINICSVLQVNPMMFADMEKSRKVS